MALDGNPIGNGTYVSHLVGMNDIFKPEVGAEMNKRYGQGVTLSLMMNSMNRYRPVARETWRQFEEGQYHRPFKLKANTTAAGGAGQAVNMILSAEDVDSNNQYYPRRGFHVGVTVGGDIQMCNIENITASGSTITLSVKPFDSSVTIPALNAGTEIAILSHAKGIGTDQPDPSRMNYVSRDFRLQVMGETIAADGGAMTDQTWFTKWAVDPNGVLQRDKITNQPILNIWHPEFKRAEMLLDMYQDNMALIGQLNSNSITQTANNMNSNGGTAGVGNTIYTSKGLFTWSKELGGKTDYTQGSWALTDLDACEDHMRSQGVNSGMILHLVGSKLRKQINNACVAKLKDDSLMSGVVDTYFGGSKKLSLSLGFQVINTGSFIHVFQTLDTFDNPWFLGASSYNYNERGIAFPVSNVRTQDDNGTKTMLPNVSFVYKAKNGYSRKREMWMEGAAGKGIYLDRYTGPSDLAKAYFRSHIGMECLGMNQTFRYNPS